MAGANRFGTFAGGGVSFVMSDMLGDRTLGAVVQIQGEFDTFGGQLSRSMLEEYRHVTIGLEMSIAQLTGEKFDYMARVSADDTKPKTRARWSRKWKRRSRNPIRSCRSHRSRA